MAGRECPQIQDHVRFVGDHVIAKATHITSLPKCSNSKTEELQGVVVEVLSTKTSTGWMSNVVVVNYKLGGGVMKWGFSQHSECEGCTSRGNQGGGNCSGGGDCNSGSCTTG